jgi:hypothetical protein
MADSLSFEEFDARREALLERAARINARHEPKDDEE